MFARESPGLQGRVGSPSPAPDGGATDTAEHRLLSEVRRALRRPHRRVALVLGLSSVPCPGPRLHHRRIAKALLQDAAQRYDGEVWTLGSGDLVLICRSDPDAHAGHRTAPRALPGVLAQVFRADRPGPSPLVRLWSLEDDGGAVLAYAVAQVAAAGLAPHMEDDPASTLRAADPIDSLLAAGQALDLIRRQTSAALGLDGQGPRLVPLFQELTFSVDALRARAAWLAGVIDDPLLFKHLAGWLDRRMLTILDERLGRGGVGDLLCGQGTPPIHVNLTIGTIGSATFERLVRRLPAAPGLAVGIGLLDACADPDGFVRASERLARAGIDLVLQGLSHRSLLLADPSSLTRGLCKIAWTPEMACLGPRDDAALARAMQRIGAGRIVLDRADHEDALSWGMARGIRRFQGRYVDTMMAAVRVEDCAFAPGCTLRQCAERGEVVGDAGRRLCRNTVLLDAAVPEQPPERAYRIAA